jgi:Zn-finger nucleic acid-binding protein
VKCPVDSSELTISDRQGVEIDFCPQCRGVWLDRGELDKIIERSSSWDDDRRGGRGRDRRDDDDDDEGGIGGFFGRLFDFG